jgi:hypothetical protein
MTLWPSRDSRSNRITATSPLALVEDGLNTLVPVARHGFPVKDGAIDGPR